MGHLFTAKYKTILETITSDQLVETLKEVTLYDNVLRKEFEKDVMSII